MPDVKSFLNKFCKFKSSEPFLRNKYGRSVISAGRNSAVNADEFYFSGSNHIGVAIMHMVVKAEYCNSKLFNQFFFGATDRSVRKNILMVVINRLMNNQQLGTPFGRFLDYIRRPEHGDGNFGYGVFDVSRFNGIQRVTQKNQQPFQARLLYLLSANQTLPKISYKYNITSFFLRKKKNFCLFYYFVQSFTDD